MGSSAPYAMADITHHVRFVGRSRPAFLKGLPNWRTIGRRESLIRSPYPPAAKTIRESQAQTPSPP